MKELSTSVKKIFLAAIISGIVVGVVQIIFQQYTENAYAKFGSIECKRLWITSDDGQTRMLLAADDEGGFLTVNGKGREHPDYRKTVGLSISELGGKIVLNGTSGMVTIEAGDGIHVSGRDGKIVDSLPYHSHAEEHDDH